MANWEVVYVPGKTRVSALAKELGITSREAVAELFAIGEYVKSASSTIEAPAAAALRRRCGSPVRLEAQRARQPGRPRTYPRNNPYMDLGRTEVDHQQTADRRPRHVAGSASSATTEPLGPPPARVGRPRREWYRDSEPSEFDRFVLEQLIVPRRDPDAWTPEAPWLYFEDEVEEARGITGRWMPLLLEGMDYEEILDWRESLDPLSVRSFIVDYPDAPEHAIELHAAGVSVYDLRWRPEDQGWGTLPDRLRRRTMTVGEVITEVGYRRAEDAS